MKPGVEIGMNSITNYSVDVVMTTAQVVDNLFCLFFTYEISVRFFAYQRSKDAFKDRNSR